MKDNESIFSCITQDFQDVSSSSRSWDCFFIGTGFFCFFAGIAYLLIFRFSLTDRRESFKNTKYKKPKLINQLFKKKYENNIFFKY